MKKILFILISIVSISQFSHAQCDDCGTRIVQNTSGVSQFTNNGDGSYTHISGSGVATTFSVADFTNLTTQQITELTEAIEFTQLISTLTPTEQAALCQAIIDAGCDLTELVDFTQLTTQQTTDLCNALNVGLTVTGGADNDPTNATSTTTIDLCGGDGLHFFSGDGSIEVGVTSGSAIVDLQVDPDLVADNETVTTLIDNGNQTFTYTNEANLTTTFSVAGQINSWSIGTGDYNLLTFPAAQPQNAHANAKDGDTNRERYGNGYASFTHNGTDWTLNTFESNEDNKLTNVEVLGQDYVDGSLSGPQNAPANPVVGDVHAELYDNSLVFFNYSLPNGWDGNNITYVPLTGTNYANADLTSDADRTHTWGHNQTEEFIAGTEHRRQYGNVNFSGASVTESDNGFTARNLSLSGDQEAEVAVTAARSQLFASDIDATGAPEVSVIADANPLVGGSLQYLQSGAGGGEVAFRARGLNGNSELYLRDYTINNGVPTAGMVFTLQDPVNGRGRWDALPTADVVALDSIWMVGDTTFFRNFDGDELDTLVAGLAEKEIVDCVETRLTAVSIPVPADYTLVRDYTVNIVNSDNTTASFSISANEDATAAEQAATWADEFNSSANIQGTWIVNGASIEADFNQGDIYPVDVDANITSLLSFNSGASPVETITDLQWTQTDSDLSAAITLGTLNTLNSVSGGNGILAGESVTGSPDDIQLSSTFVGWTPPSTIRLRVNDLDPGPGEFVEFDKVPDLVEDVSGGSNFTLTGSRVDPLINNVDIYAHFNNTDNLEMQQRAFVGGSNRIGYVQVRATWDYDLSIVIDAGEIITLTRCGDVFTDENDNVVAEPDTWAACGTYDAIEDSSGPVSDLEAYMNLNYIQHGVITMTNNVETITLPESYANTNYTVQLTARDNQAFFATELDLGSRTANSFQISAYNENGINVLTDVQYTVIGQKQ